MTRVSSYRRLLIFLEIMVNSNYLGLHPEERAPERGSYRVEDRGRIPVDIRELRRGGELNFQIKSR